MVKEVKKEAAEGNKAPLPLRINREILKQLKQAAAEQNRTVTNMVETILLEYFRQKI